MASLRGAAAPNIVATDGAEMFERVQRGRHMMKCRAQFEDLRRGRAVRQERERAQIAAKVSVKIRAFVFVVAEKTAQIGFPIAERRKWAGSARLLHELFDRRPLCRRRGRQRSFEKKNRFGGAILAQ